MRNVLFLLAAIPLALPVHAYEFSEVSDETRDCYSAAMIGMDSVINARVGVPAEHALALTLRVSDSLISGSHYNDEILTVIWGGYLWAGTPHSYAISVFFHCARDTAGMTSAGLFEVGVKVE